MTEMLGKLILLSESVDSDGSVELSKSFHSDLSGLF